MPKRGPTTQADVRRELALPESGPAPDARAPRTTRKELETRLSGSRRPGRTPRRSGTAAPAATTTGTVSAVTAGTASVAANGAAKDAPVKQRLFAHPDRPRAAAAMVEGQKAGLGRLDPSREGDEAGCGEGSRVTAGTVLGSVGRGPAGGAANVRFEIRPAGRGAPRIDPKPILDGWKLLESTAIYRAKGTNPFFGPDAATPSVGQILLMGKDSLAERVLTDPHIEIYACGREDIRAGLVDQRVLATLEYLAASGLRPTVSSLECGHSYLTASGNVSEHSSGNAVDIAAINGVPIAGNQGPGRSPRSPSSGCSPSRGR